MSNDQLMPIMKKSNDNIWSGLAAVVVGSGFLVSGNVVFAGNDVSSSFEGVEIRGEIEVYTAIIVTGKPARNIGEISHSGVAVVSVATVKEICNALPGYDVTVQSANRTSGAANLVSTSGDKIAYSIFYGGPTDAVSMTGTDPVNITAASAPTDGDGVDKDLRISIASGYRTAGSYSDTLTFSITAK